MTQTRRVADPGVPIDERQVPFSVVDEAIQLLDADTAPWSIQLEARVAGRLDEARLRRAVGSALDAHPMARARRIASSRWLSRDRWAFPRHRPDVLRVVDCFDDDQLAAARAELQSLPTPLTVAPPLRAWLAHHPEGDVLMLHVHHAAMDGFGAARVLRSIARAYAGEPDPEPKVDFDEARQLPACLLQAGGLTRLRRAAVLAERLADLVLPPARIAADGATPRAGYGFQTRTLSTGQTAALVAAEHAGTVNDLLLSALHLTIATWNAEHGARRGRIAVLVPANLRPAAWREDVAGNFALPARVSTNPRTRRSRRAVLGAVTGQTVRKKRSGMGGAILELLRHTDALPLWAKAGMVKLLPLTGNRLVDTSMFSNLGVLSEPLDFGEDAGPVTEVWFSPPSRMPLGVCVGAVTSAGRLHLVFRHRHSQCSEEAAARFADRYLVELDHLSRALSPERRRRRASGYGLGLPPPVSPAYRRFGRRTPVVGRAAS